ncbi:MAG: ATP phosphoribosyltransferase [Pseudomonadales bacterium]
MGLTIALNRGRILTECLPLLARIGIEPVEDISKSRKLVFDTRTGGHRLLVVRGSDVPTYVEYGAADMGVVGKDTLLEHGSCSGFYERLDLGIGGCRLMTAVPKERADVGLMPAPGHTKLRIATKFVRTTAEYFAAAQREVSIIKLSGAMEIAPVMGLADAIVDIVDTGNTLKANGLVAQDTIADISSRLIVNRASTKTEFAAVSQLLNALRDVVRG